MVAASTPARAHLVRDHGVIVDAVAGAELVHVLAILDLDAPLEDVDDLLALVAGERALAAGPHDDAERFHVASALAGSKGEELELAAVARARLQAAQALHRVGLAGARDDWAICASSSSSVPRRQPKARVILMSGASDGASSPASSPSMTPASQPLRSATCSTLSPSDSRSVASFTPIRVSGCHPPALRPRAGVAKPRRPAAVKKSCRGGAARRGRESA